MWRFEDILRLVLRWVCTVPGRGELVLTGQVHRFAARTKQHLKAGWIEATAAQSEQVGRDKAELTI